MSITFLREKVIVQVRANVPDQVGGYRVSWADREAIWVELKPLESSTADVNETKLPAANRYRVRWRYGTKVPSSARLKWRGVNYRFISRPCIDPLRRWVSAIVQAGYNSDE